MCECIGQDTTSKLQNFCNLRQRESLRFEKSKISVNTGNLPHLFFVQTEIVEHRQREIADKKNQRMFPNHPVKIPSFPADG